MSCTDSSILTLTAGQVSAVPIEFSNADGSPVDLTGATVHLVGKASFGDAETLLEIEQATHVDAAAGETTLPVDLSAAPAAWFSDGARFAASLWIVDAQDQVVPWGNLTILIEPSAISPAEA